MSSGPERKAQDSAALAPNESSVVLGFIVLDDLL